MPNKSNARILLLDIEATGLNADFSTILCFGYKWYGDKSAKVISISDYPGYEKDPTDDKPLHRDIKKLMEEADMYVTWYGAGYDRKMLQTKFLYHGLGAIPPTPNVDLWWWSKHRLKMHSNRLAAIADYFNLGEKTAVRGRQWMRAMCGHKPSLQYVIKHCAIDVEVLEKAYELMRPLVTSHPNVSELNLAKNVVCKICASRELQKRGFSLSRQGRKQRYQCKDCSAWS